MTNTIKIVALGVITLFAMFAANFARDLSYQVHAIIVMLVAGGLFLLHVRRIGDPVAVAGTGYMDDVIRYGVIATTFWGVVGFLAGTSRHGAPETETASPLDPSGSGCARGDRSR
jgi:cytochrome c oxidase cbb3-type subunit 1